MPDCTEIPRDILKKYADTLMSNAQATTQEEQDESADELIEITGTIEANGKEIAQLIYELLEHGPQA